MISARGESSFCLCPNSILLVLMAGKSLLSLVHGLKRFHLVVFDGKIKSVSF